MFLPYSAEHKHECVGFKLVFYIFHFLCLQDMSNSSGSSSFFQDLFTENLNYITNAVMNFVGIFAYLLVFYGVSVNRELRVLPSYMFVLSQGVSDVLTILTGLCYVLPAWLLGREPGGPGATLFVGMVSNLAWYSLLPCMALLAINRYCTICHFARST